MSGDIMHPGWAWLILWINKDNVHFLLGDNMLGDVFMEREIEGDRVIWVG